MSDVDKLRTKLLSMGVTRTELLGEDPLDVLDSLAADLARARSRNAALRRELDDVRPLLLVALKYLGAGDHDCTGPEECWTCAVDVVLAPSLQENDKGRSTE